MPGIDPGASRVQSERSTIWATSPIFSINFININIILNIGTIYFYLFIYLFFFSIILFLFFFFWVVYLLFFINTRKNKFSILIFLEEFFCFIIIFISNFYFKEYVCLLTTKNIYGKNFLIEFIALNIKQNKTFLPIFLKFVSICEYYLK